MSRIVRLLARLLADDYCDECGASKMGGPGGSWWHHDECSRTRPPAPPPSRD